MIFCVYDWTSQKNLSVIPGIKRKTVEWFTCGGTNKKPTKQLQSEEISYIELSSLEELLNFMHNNNIILQIIPPQQDSNGCGFPHYCIYTDTPSGKFRQR